MAADDRPRRLPPYGRQYLDNPPGAGFQVACGSDPWKIAKGKSFPVVVLPTGSKPSDYDWPTTSGPALIYETGPLDDDLLYELAKTLMLAGAPSVVAIRESLFKSSECCLFFEAVPCGE
ncbi:MAG: hypothetical protein IH899_10460 [Planctomycetes bacterium]|nr:hypothetical protein [Planctomycetota bacterium]